MELTAYNTTSDKERKDMAREEIMQELDRIETALFMEQMADFMNWGNYYKLMARKAELQAMLTK